MSDRNAAPGEPGYLRPGTAWYLVLVLMLIYVLSFIDRQILALLVKPIREAMTISDGQMGLLMGLAFAVFYTFFGIPLGWLADRYNRVLLIGIGLIVWSFMTVGCGLSNTFSTLLFFRFGVGIGEAVLSPAAYSMIADSFPPRKLATAISAYSMGIYLGSGLSLLVGGLIIAYAEKGSVPVLPVFGQVSPWQFVFIVVGLAGLPLSLLLFTVKEPTRHKSAAEPSFAKTIAYIKEHKGAFFLHSCGFGMLALVGYANMGWVVTFFERAHQWPRPETAKWYGIAILTAGTLGILAGGRLADALRAKGHSDGSMRTCILSATLSLFLMAAFPLVPSATLSMCIVAALTFTTSMASGAAPTVIQQMMPPAMRGQASAIYLFIVNIIAMGIGPTAVGLLSTKVFGDAGLNYALVLVGVTGCLLSAILLMLGLAPLRRAAAEVEAIAARASGI